VIVPTHDHAMTLDLAVRSILDQTCTDVEAIVIGDGVGDDTREVMDLVCAQDDRVRFFDLPKAPSHGEIYRGQAVDASEAEVVCYLCDDDLLLPDHVETMVELLSQADLAQSLNGYIDVNGRWHPYFGDLSVPQCREWLKQPGCNFVSLTGMAHTASAYRRLRHGWRTTPSGVWPDHFMVQQFVAEPWLRAVTSSRVTTLQFPSHGRRKLPRWTTEARRKELEEWIARIGEPGGRARFDRVVNSALLAEGSKYRVTADALEKWIASLNPNEVPPPRG
jgi:glycosyltransferase involved in cell wall biosynthesis